MGRENDYNTTGDDYTLYPVPEKDGWRFTVWAPEKKRMTLQLLARDTSIAMQKDRFGYFSAFVESVAAGDRYYYVPDGGKPYPDPASQYQPEGVHGPSQLVDHGQHAWEDDTWRGRPLCSLVFYEIHVGSFTPDGTFDAIIPRLDELADLGITAIE
ncbi:MAG TPA: hypothetical protein VGR89_05435, partial [Puia sp.]|nr:hypothetical protein [Puia sp.]